MLKRKAPLRRTAFPRNMNARKPLPRQSSRRAKRNREAAPVRESLLAKHTKCMVCGHSPANPWPDKPRECSKLCVHEIANGINRAAAIDKPYACLVLCWWCNGNEVTNKRRWPEERQLAVLLAVSPADYDLAAYLRLTNPRAMKRITEVEVIKAAYEMGRTR